MSKSNHETIITDALDQDFYKLTMQHAALHQFPATQCKYRFVCRKSAFPLGLIKDDVQRELEHVTTLGVRADHITKLRGIRFFQPDYVDFLSLFKSNMDGFHIGTDTDNNLQVEIEGSWVHKIWWELYLLPIISELHTRYVAAEKGYDWDELHRQHEEATLGKVAYIKQNARPTFKFSDFGTRRRMSRRAHQRAIEIFANEVPQHFVGTSNVAFALDMGLTPIGTMAHEWAMAGQGFKQTQLRHSVTFMMEAWAREYRGDLGYALPDTITMDTFLADFDLYLTKLFDGSRIDSGKMEDGIQKLINHYRKHRIDPKTKTAIPSDGLNIPYAIQLEKQFGDVINVSAGIGQNLVHDCAVPKPSIVMKMVKCNGHPVAKISDEPGKSICDDPQFMSYLKHVFDLPEGA